MTIIKDPNFGYAAKVDIKGKLRTYGIVESEFLHHSEDDGLSFSFRNITYDYGAADTILLVTNISSDVALHITKIWAFGDTDTAVVIHCPTTAYASLTGTNVSGVNLNRSSGNDPDAYTDAWADETGNTQGDVVWSGYIAASADDVAKGPIVDFDGALVLGYHNSVGVDFVTDGAAAVVTIFGYMHA